MGVTATPEVVNNSKSAQPAHELTVLATVAHELRGPLTALATSSELLAEDFAHLDPEQVKSMLEAMHRRTLWLQGLVENLLCAATIREGPSPCTAKRSALPICWPTSTPSSVRCSPNADSACAYAWSAGRPKSSLTAVD